MKFFSAFAGIGGFDLGIKRAIPGAECVGYSEKDKYAIEIYERQFPDSINYGDITRTEPKTLPDFDWFCGGFPCQDLSIAGKRAGLCGARSGLFFDIIRIIREKQPKLVFLENVKGLFSSNGGRDFARIIIELDAVGYDVEWQCLNSKNFGVPQNRERVFIIGHLRGTSGGQIFPIGENGETVNDLQKPTTNTLRARYEGGQAVGSYIIENKLDAQGIPKIAGCLTGGGHSRGLHSDMTIIQMNQPTHSNDRIYSAGGISPTLNCMEGGNRQPFVACGIRSDEGVRTFTDNVMGTLRSNSSHNGSKGVTDGTNIRRLTPIECERLQGYPDNWTAGVSDTQRYKCLGNAVTVNVIKAIAERIGELTDNMIPVEAYFSDKEEVLA